MMTAGLPFSGTVSAEPSNCWPRSLGAASPRLGSLAFVVRDSGDPVTVTFPNSTSPSGTIVVLDGFWVVVVEASEVLVLEPPAVVVVLPAWSIGVGDGRVATTT